MIEWKLADFLEPSWTNPGDFLVKYKGNFDDLRRFSQSLEKNTENLKSQLSQIIHQDYADFVLISKQLLQLGEYMANLLTGLQTAEKEISKASNTLLSSSQPLREQSERLQSVRHEASLCEIALESIENLQNISKQLQNKDDIYSFFDVAVGFSVTKAKMIGIDQPALTKPIGMEYDKLMKKFVIQLNQRFINAIRDRNTDDFLLLLNISIVAGLQTEFYKSFSDAFILTKLTEIEQKIRINKRTTNYDIVFSTLFDILTLDQSPIVFIAKTAPKETFDFCFNSFWTIVSPWLEKNLMFPVGNPTEQFKAFKQWNQFIDVVESLCSQPDLIRNQQITIKIKGNIRLDIYAQLIGSDTLTKANAHFKEPIQKINGDFCLSVSEQVFKLFQNLFNENIFIMEQCKYFGVIAMKLMASFQQYVLAQKQFQPEFIKDCQAMSTKLLEVSPINLCKAFELTIVKEFSIVTQKIEDLIIESISEKCIVTLDYIQDLSSLNLRSSVSASPKVQTTLQPYMQWAKSEGSIIASSIIMAKVVENVLKVFKEKSFAKLSDIQKTYESIYKLRKDKADPNLFKVDGIKNQLLTDVQYIANIARSQKVLVDSMDIFIEIQSMLEIDK